MVAYLRRLVKGRRFLFQMTNYKDILAKLHSNCNLLREREARYGTNTCLNVYGVDAEAAEALGQLGDTRAVKPLIAALRGGDMQLREAAVQALVKFKNTAVEPLINTLHDKDETVRSEVVDALGQLRDVRAIKPLIDALGDKDWLVRDKAAETLGKLAVLLTEPQGRFIARHLWQEAISPDQPDIYEPLLSVSNRLAVLEVERLPTPKYPDF
ncbi:MAG: HEAT repeat domain-containing protein [Anaerolineae bacterium]|nr:HEAT repeat domain-containing protein [Anaerolineae bacterium]